LLIGLGAFLVNAAFVAESQEKLGGKRVWDFSKYRGVGFRV
jgi:hypothetical protein